MQYRTKEGIEQKTATGYIGLSIVKCLSLFALLSSLLVGCASMSYTTVPESKNHDQIEERWGIQIEGIRLSASGHMLDFRYRITDPDKAVELVDRTNKPYVIAQKTGRNLGVPHGKVGPLRQTVKFGKPKKDRTYFVLFSNAGKLVKEGDSVTVVIGEFRTDLVVR